jgi:hypothetical protein
MKSQRTLSKEQNFRIFSELASVFEALGRKIMEKPGHTARKGKGKQGLHCGFYDFYASGVTKSLV